MVDDTPATADELGRLLCVVQQDYVVRPGADGEPRWWPNGHERPVPLTTSDLLVLLRDRSES